MSESTIENSEDRMEESPPGSETESITPEQICQNLALLWEIQRSEIELSQGGARQPLSSYRRKWASSSGTERLQMELRANVALIFCPILTCKNHYPHEVEKDSREEISEPPFIQAKPIMLRIVKNYNLTVQEINRKFPATVNKMTGNYIKVQPGSIEDHRDITAMLEERKAEHYVIEPLANRPIKVVIKRLPNLTDVADTEADLVKKGFAIEEVAQLRKFSTKAPLLIFMVEIRRTDMAGKIYDVKNVCYLCVTIDPFHRKPGVTQCYNCNYLTTRAKTVK
ncbi:nucleic-acid-binding protein from transposon X-element [Trichonephila inaurata madagascariensis]|uniref:Nucleic-acid-binding protein from transposon X-element n=1 Tax=Trichonephila inaurata madagascariensis TaxID=2747483 RepID=A0A8X6YVN3_9ARAC|nr:nucleic-acid-binding protein from transposon X-element [Trichonephila inaurata madagascariensis]